VITLSDDAKERSPVWRSRAIYFIGAWLIRLLRRVTRAATGGFPAGSRCDCG